MGGEGDLRRSEASLVLALPLLVLLVLLLREERRLLAVVEEKEERWRSGKECGRSFPLKNRWSAVDDAGESGVRHDSNSNVSLSSSGVLGNEKASSVEGLRRRRGMVSMAEFVVSIAEREREKEIEFGVWSCFEGREAMEVYIYVYMCVINAFL